MVPGRGWAPVSPVRELRALWGAAPGQPCSAVTYGTGMEQAMPFASLCRGPAASSLPCSATVTPACSRGGSFPHVSTAHANTRLWAAETCRWGKMCPAGCAASGPRAARLWQGCTLAAHPARHRGETPRPHCHHSVPADAAVATFPRPGVALRGSLAERSGGWGLAA